MGRGERLQQLVTWKRTWLLRHLALDRRDILKAHVYRQSLLGHDTCSATQLAAPLQVGLAAAGGAGDGSGDGGIQVVTSNPISLSNPIDLLGGNYNGASEKLRGTGGSSGTGQYTGLCLVQASVEALVPNPA